jgi:murein DD-endopeptidase MepM/ murein hydrolase activator NlpD
VTPKPQEKARLAQASTTPTELSTETPVKATEATGALPTFRWPVRGKVITSYGAKPNGKANDGINLSVPEGTPVRAAEDGVVDYSGNEQKSYGNLILIRHSNGYVTAYAHASEVLVRRGDAIKRGQIIAKSGQSGDVGSPQLHFEIRKGSLPVDPLQFLNGA